jgi:hypothetical protein
VHTLRSFESLHVVSPVRGAPLPDLLQAVLQEQVQQDLGELSQVRGRRTCRLLGTVPAQALDTNRVFREVSYASGVYCSDGIGNSAIKNRIVLTVGFRFD